MSRSTSQARASLTFGLSKGGLVISKARSPKTLPGPWKNLTVLSLRRASVWPGGRVRTASTLPYLSSDTAVAGFGMILTVISSTSALSP